MMVQKITIIGVGMIGGSLGLALKGGGSAAREITGVDTDRAGLEAALGRGAIDRIADRPAVGVADADVVFLCSPVLQIPELVAEILPHMKREAVITDVGSTKGFLRQKIATLIPSHIHYIGGHPMAGREKSGIAAADGALFRDKLYILTPNTAASPAAVETVRQLVLSTGAKPVMMDVDQHDHAAAIISHVPHVAAAALVNLLDRYPGKEQSLANLAGGGFCDTTRIASSNADMWADICLTNAPAITDGLQELSAVITEVMAAIDRGDRAVLHAFFRQAKDRRDRIISSL